MAQNTTTIENTEMIESNVTKMVEERIYPHVVSENEEDIEMDLNSFRSESDTSTDLDGNSVHLQQQTEVLAIENKTKRESSLVNVWRWAVRAILLATAVGVTIATYSLLDAKENQNFEIAYEQFARTVGNAAVTQQLDLRDSIASLANIISGLAENQNATWPYFHPPKFQLYAEDFKRISSGEYVGLNNHVTREQRDTFIEWMDTQYESMIQEAHMVAFGNLDLLDTNPARYNSFVSRKNASGVFVPDIDRPYHSVRTSTSPPPRAYGPITNINIGSIGANGALVESCRALGNETLVSTVKPFQALPREEHANFHLDNPEGIDYPHSFFYYPVRQVPKDSSSPIVATLNVAHPWDVSMRKLLPESVQGIVAVLENNCDQVFTFVINGHNVSYVGPEDAHDLSYDKFELEVDLTPHTHPNFTTIGGHCMYTMRIYPSDSFKANYDSIIPEAFCAAVILMFVFIALVFLGFDFMVRRRNDKLVNNAAQSNALVGSLFPGMFRDRVLDERAEKSKSNVPTQGNNLRTFLNTGDMAQKQKEYDMEKVDKSKPPLADLFQETTVMFGDLVGFTAWSSGRDPSQVFTLLETIYGAFDKLAKRRKVFKVETIGDCYVAVTGVPFPMENHAIAMAGFADSCMSEMKRVTKELEPILGAGTRDLQLRVGLHSGPVIAGVLRGERSRFQLFGDTMNTAARMESTSKSGCIQLSPDCARLLIAMNKERWIEKREDTIVAKGKGEMQTYWLRIPSLSTGTKSSSSEPGKTVSTSDGTSTVISDINSMDNLDILDEKTNRLVEWNTEIMLGIIKEIIASHDGMVASEREKRTRPSFENHRPMPVKEVSERISFLERSNSDNSKNKAKDIVVPAVVAAELKDFLSMIAGMYNPHSFHNFDHASHVAMSLFQLMSRIATPGDDSSSFSSRSSRNGDGVTIDPLTTFACIFTALIHDVDHFGVPNTQLIKENPRLAKTYENRSVAEQNSFNEAWELFTQGPYSNLRATLFVEEDELSRFRQIVINGIMATDLADKDLKRDREDRWARAFHNKSVDTDSNLQTTVLIEMLIQVSDISHTMQDWRVYRKWNERLFDEMYVAYKNGRAGKNPVDYWFQGELDFFDYYIIPMAKKLEACGVFSGNSDVYLNYATKNRDEWKVQGEKIVSHMMKKYEQ